MGIWGVIGYRILSAINPTGPKMTIDNVDVSFNPKTNKEADTFSIQVQHRDPFLGTLLVKKVNTKETKITKKSEAVWIPIIYNGCISSKNEKTKVFIVSINSQQYIMKIGQKINEVTLIKGNDKEIVVRYKDASKTVLKT